MLSFGATKGGAMGAEAVIVFDRAWPNILDRRKRAGELVSKNRFIAAQMEAFLQMICGSKLARHANAMADALAPG